MENLERFFMYENFSNSLKTFWNILRTIKYEISRIPFRILNARVINARVWEFDCERQLQPFQGKQLMFSQSVRLFILFCIH